MPSFRLLLLGPVRLLDSDGVDVRGLGAKARGALALLAAQPQRACARDRLADSDLGRASPRHALRQMLLVLRQRLGPHADRVVVADGFRLVLGAALETDLAEFEAHLAAGRVEAACTLWRGRFCEGLDAGGDGFEEWLALERARIDDLAAEAFARASVEAAAAGRLDVAVAAARRRVAIYPLDDAAQAELIGLYRRRGWTGAAADAHRRCDALFRSELGIAPDARVAAAACAPVAPHVPTRPPFAGLGRPAARRLSRWAAAAAIAGLGYLLATPPGLEPTAAASTAWVDASEWQAAARPDSGDVPLAEAIARGLAGDPEFAHLVPGGC